MTDRLRLAAQALVDAMEGVRLPYCDKAWIRLIDLRRALAEPAPCEHANTVRRRDGSKCLDCGEPLLGVFR